MSIQKKQKHPNLGGEKRPVGRPPGQTKAKICVSVDAANWQSAIKHWKKKGSRLVDKLVSRYLNDGSLRAALEVS